VTVTSPVRVTSQGAHLQRRAPIQKTHRNSQEHHRPPTWQRQPTAPTWTPPRHQGLSLAQHQPATHSPRCNEPVPWMPSARHRQSTRPTDPSRSIQQRHLAHTGTGLRSTLLPTPDKMQTGYEQCQCQCQFVPGVKDGTIGPNGIGSQFLRAIPKGLGDNGLVACMAVGRSTMYWLCCEAISAPMALLSAFAGLTNAHPGKGVLDEV
jgi:hypothetical protein